MISDIIITTNTFDPGQTAQDTAKVLSDFHINMSAGTIMLFFAIGIPLVKSLASYARKAIPDSAQVNKAGLLLAHVAGEVNPSIAKLGTEAQSQSLTSPK